MNRETWLYRWRRESESNPEPIAAFEQRRSGLWERIGGLWNRRASGGRRRGATEPPAQSVAGPLAHGLF